MSAVASMRLDLNSVRSKMLFPAVVAVLAMLVVAAVTVTVSFVARHSLTASKADLRKLLLLQDVRRQVDEAHLELKVAAGGDPFNVGVANGNHDEAVRLLTEEAPDIIGKEAAEKLKAEIEAYYKAASADALVQADANMARAKDEKVAGSEAVATAYEKLIKEIDQLTLSARDTLNTSFDSVSTSQLWSILSTVAIVLLAGAGSGALAWWLSGRTATPLRTLSELTTRIADGDLTPEVTFTSSDEVGVLADGFRRMVGRLRELVSTLKTAAEELGVSAEKLGDATRAQAAMLERQASGVAETGSTTRQLEQTSAMAANRAATVLEVARRAAEMSDTGRGSAERSAEELKRIQESIDAIVGQTGKLLEQARQVGYIVGTVRDLAGQSHILSLNASIEAARAGEAGKGFAVVALEVRALADQSGKSAGKIGKMVQEILSAVQATRVMTSRGSEAMAGSLDQIRASGDSLREIGGIVRESSDAVQQIAKVVQEQFAGIGQISTAMRDLDRGMEETVARIRSLEESAQQVAETAVRISGIAGEFKV